MGNAFDHLDLDEMACQQAQRPPGVAFGRFGAGQLRHARLDLASDLDFARWFFPHLARQCSDRSDLAATDAETFERARRHSCGQADLGILASGTERPLVGHQQCYSPQESGGLAALLATDGFEFAALIF